MVRSRPSFKTSDGLARSPPLGCDVLPVSAPARLMKNLPRGLRPKRDNTRDAGIAPARIINTRARDRRGWS